MPTASFNNISIIVPRNGIQKVPNSKYLNSLAITAEIRTLRKDFIDHFYELKKTATLNKDLTKKLIAKLHLNTLYGMFGRKLDSLSSMPCKASEE